MKITVNTQLGTGGKWITVASFAVGPRNLMKASLALEAEIRENRGTGGYRSTLQIGKHVIGPENIDWGLNTERAKRIIADPAEYAPYTGDHYA